ncbi:MAG: pyridoxal-dependent decarboxylase [Clostridiales bacterium]|nr:pyridoxal-dependent decarboxylase [Clostridiales bacterium]
MLINKEYTNLNTPCYIINKEKLKHNYYSMRKSFQKFWSENFIIGYSFKTNSLPWVVNWMKENGAYAEVVSEPEYRLAMTLGYDKDKVIINGPYKGLNVLIEVLENGGIVNLDSFHEIEWIKKHKPIKQKKWKVGIRINFDLESKCPNETIMGNEFGRFGFNIENGSCKKAINELKQIDYVNLVGIHGHHSTKTKSLNIFKAIAKEILLISEEIKGDIEYIDMGGCIFGDKPGAPSFDEYANVITGELKKSFDCKKVTLIMEPGAALIASPVRYLCKVIDKKDIMNIRFVSTNGSLIHIDPQMHGIPFLKESFPTGNNIKKTQVIGGFTCIEKDRLGSLENERELEIGDYLLYHNTGAYSMALSPLFIQYYPDVYVEDIDEIKLVREAWTVNEYIAKNNYKI